VANFNVGVSRERDRTYLLIIHGIVSIQLPKLADSRIILTELTAHVPYSNSRNTTLLHRL